MIAELGQILLLGALLVSLILGILPMWGAYRGNVLLMQVGPRAAFVQCALLAAAFGVLAHAFIAQDFSVEYVARNSNSLLPLHYRISAVWGAHEGSLLLWAFILALWTAAVAWFSGALPEAFRARVLGVLGWVSTGFLLFVIYTSNPFARLLPAATEGMDLNPLLQDFGLIIHPPLLYMGYVGFSVSFAFAIAALLGQQVNREWVRWSRPWTHVAWSFLTIGIALGSWWAYYELGWGGWWFWDPVENASFMPWLVGTALIHSQAVTEKRGAFRNWTLILAISTFSLSLLGTFLVRSGVITSVHAFASDPTRGVFILTYLLIVVGGSMLLFALRAPGMIQGGRFAGFWRETLLLLNNLLLTVMAAMVLIGTLYPLLVDALGAGKISVGPPYFGTLFALLLIPLAALLPLGFNARWQRDDIRRVLRDLVLPGGLAVLGGIVTGFVLPDSGWAGIAAVTGGVWIISATAQFYVRCWRGGLSTRPKRSQTGMCLAHWGVGIFLIGAGLSSTISSEKHLRMNPGDVFQLAAYEFEFKGTHAVEGPNYIADQGEFTVYRSDKRVTTLYPQKRRYLMGGQVMTEAAIDPGLTRDLYISLGEPLDDAGKSWAVRIYHKPFVRLVWIGALFMMAGGFLAASDRRYRRSLGDQVPVVPVASQGMHEGLGMGGGPIPLLVIILLGVLLAVGLGRSSTKSDIPSPLIGKPIPEFTLPLLTDAAVQLKHTDLLGEPFLLNVWASWCVTCRYEHPVIEALSTSGKLRVVGLNYRDAPEDALRWLEEFGNPYDLIIADQNGRVAIDFGVYAAPESFLVDADGVIRFKQIWRLTPEIIEREILPRLAGETQP